MHQKSCFLENLVRIWSEAEGGKEIQSRLFLYV